MAGHVAGSVAIGPVRQTMDEPYKMTYKRIKLTDVAAKTRHLDPKYIINNCNIDDSFKKYLAPIVGELPVIEQI